MNTRKRYIFQGLFFVMAALASISAIATDLQGEINSHDGNAKVTLTVNLQSNPGDTAGKLTYGSPFDCALNVVTRGSDRDNEKQVFSLALPSGLISTPETGPKCTDLVNSGAYVELTPGEAGWVISVKNSQNQLKQQGTLIVKN